MLQSRFSQATVPSVPQIADVNRLGDCAFNPGSRSVMLFKRLSCLSLPCLLQGQMLLLRL